MIKKICYIFLCLILTSCSLFPKLNLFDDSEKDLEPKYESKKEWELQLSVKRMQLDNHVLQEGRYLFINERSEDEKSFFISKIDLETGSYIWKSQIINHAYPETAPALLERDGKKYIFILCNNNKLYGELFFCFNEENGELLASIYAKNQKVTISHQLLPCNGNIYYAGAYIFKGEYYEPEEKFDGFLRLNIEKINFEKPADEVQEIAIDLLWEDEEQHYPIHMYPVKKDNVIFFVTWNSEDASENGHVTIVAYDTDTMSVKWQVNTYNNPGYGLNNMYILDEKLFILSGTAVGCFNINDGSVIYEVRPTMEQIKNELIVSTSHWLAGMDYYDGKLYVTNLNSSGTASSMGCKPEVIKNIICFDTKDGSYVWGYLPPHASSLCSRPVIVNGKCFVNCFFSLRVFDAKTGELLGRDDSIYGNPFAHSVSYNNKFITYNLINEETWCLVAISGD